ncbi:MAG: hypothetical protein HY706_05775 [Candidatus Hydrogenedentes bacterium]|nr:hypothetical protein [Candidatus Hydrogenedentota bacterium]
MEQHSGLTTPPQEHISDFERAVCYFTLPRTVSSVTPAIVIVFAVILLEALGALVYGVVQQNPVWMKAGTGALAATVVFGLATFMIRGLLNEVRRNRALLEAQKLPEAQAPPQDLPDPFAGHTLLRRARNAGRDAFVCTNNRGEVVYKVARVPYHKVLTLSDAQDKEILRAEIKGVKRSFLLLEGLPSRLDVYVNDECVARIKGRFNLNVPILEITCSRPAPAKYAFRENGIYRERRLVGRIYELRGRLYLDIESAELNEGILALFIGMS